MSKKYFKELGAQAPESRSKYVTKRVKFDNKIKLRGFKCNRI